MIVLGDLRHSIQIISKSITIDEYGAETVTWINSIKPRASVKYVGGDKSIDNKEIFNSKKIIFTTLYRSIITEDDRIIFKSKKYSINSIVEIGYKEGLQIEAELIND